MTVTKKNWEYRANNYGSKWTNAVAHRLRFHSAIPDDLAKALDYYEEISPTLANRFRDKVDRRLDQIAEHPEVFRSMFRQYALRRSIDFPT